MCHNIRNFNPRSHERSDIDILCISAFSPISIHAPTRGATVLQVSGCVFHHIFQSTLPREERRVACVVIGRKYNFNPRSHERSDAIVQPPLLRDYDFNPRSHERSDCNAPSGTSSVSISIHAPTRGATAILHKKFVYFYTIPTINI